MAVVEMYGEITCNTIFEDFREHTRPNRPYQAPRIAPDALAIVRRAAEIQGRSVSDFMSRCRTGSRAENCFRTPK